MNIVSIKFNDAYFELFGRAETARLPDLSFLIKKGVSYRIVNVSVPTYRE